MDLEQPSMPITAGRLRYLLRATGKEKHMEVREGALDELAQQVRRLEAVLKEVLDRPPLVQHEEWRLRAEAALRG